METILAIKNFLIDIFIPLRMYALKYCNSFELAEDIVQDLFVKFWDERLYLKA